MSFASNTMARVLDACALIAFLRDEPGADLVEGFLNDSAKCYVHALNFCEVYYDFWRAAGHEAAESAVADLLSLGIQERNDLDSQFWREVGRLKAVHRRVSWPTAVRWRWLAGSVQVWFRRIGMSLNPCWVLGFARLS